MRGHRSARTPHRMRSTRFAAFAGLLAVVAIGATRALPLNTHQQAIRKQAIPRVWDPEALKDLELPPPNADFTVEHIPPEYYYSLPERTIYKTYPMYAPGREPPGYVDSLKTLEPQIILDTDTLDTDAEWIRAGEFVFDTPQILLPLQSPFSPAALVRAGVPVAADGTLPHHRYIVLAKGDVRIGAAACSNCHQRVMPDGSVLKAVQGNYPLDRIVAQAAGMLQAQGAVQRPGVGAVTVEQFLKVRNREQFAAPWVDAPSQTMLDTLSVARSIELYSSIPPGVLLRQGSHFFYPTKVPDLRGVQHRRFLDATGLIQQRSIADLMRYASLTQSIDLLNRYNGFIPAVGTRPGPLPPQDSVQSIVSGKFTRFSDAQLFALARYLYSLEPLPSPYTLDAETLALGERVFIEQGCISCHTPPYYTNNELTPAPGFEPPEDHYDRYPIFDVSVETDPGLTLNTRRATGYYKVPSLRGLWYRERLFHDGSLSLEDVLDPARLRDDFVPSGFRGADSPAHAVPGHPFGLELGDRERAALIAYLKTL
jgi:mono/diheme cytochrome c family protein